MSPLAPALSEIPEGCGGGTGKGPQVSNKAIIAHIIIIAATVNSN